MEDAALQKQAKIKIKEEK
ncbi:Protein of unknown function [Bacillus mycoides]|nr:Protein of unknown function [Bacillus mycoides]